MFKAGELWLSNDGSALYHVLAVDARKLDMDVDYILVKVWIVTDDWNGPSAIPYNTFIMWVGTHTVKRIDNGV